MLQRDAADILELSVRRVQRLLSLYLTDGETTFASFRRGSPANTRFDEEFTRYLFLTFLKLRALM